jgi:hypothetical protein
MNSPRLPKATEAQMWESVLDNVSCALSHDGRDFLLLIKRQRAKEYCTLFLTDCCDRFWVEKLDAAYCAQLKADVGLKTSTDIFARHFAEALRSGPTIANLHPQPTLKLQLRVSEGVIVNCPLTLSICVTADSPEEYKPLLRSFFKQLYDAKEHQIAQLQLELAQLRQPSAAESAPKPHSANYRKAAFNLPEKVEAPPPSKNRDLINPIRKKRRNGGIKLTAAD